MPPSPPQSSLVRTVDKVNSGAVGNGEEQGKRIVRTQGIVLLSSGSSLPPKCTRLQLQ